MAHDDITDLLVPLHQLPPLPETVTELLRRPLPPERFELIDWVETHFTRKWAAETSVALAQTPARCFIAEQNREILGFICYDTTFRGFLGPIGVALRHRQQGLGHALTLRGLHALREDGFAYAIVGATRQKAFYQREFNALIIPGSWPGAYGELL